MSSDSGSDPLSNPSNDEEDDLDIGYAESLSSDDEQRMRAEGQEEDREGKEGSEGSEDSEASEGAVEEISEQEMRLLELMGRPEPVARAVLLAGEARLTSNVVSKYEFTKLIGLRARQIYQCSAIYVELSESEKRGLSPLEIAEREFAAKAMPLMIKRTHPNGNYELWSIEETVGYQELNDLN